ncbi:energy transducer TonB [Iodidimonas gelatinilytica]|nr:energy transducer TonB [Iodidimonas gelatinilytica]
MSRMIILLAPFILAACSAGGFGKVKHSAMRNAVYEAAAKCEQTMAALPSNADSVEFDIVLLCVERILSRGDLRVYERAVVQKLRASALGRAGKDKQAQRIFAQLMETKGLPSGFYSRALQAQAAVGNAEAQRMLMASEEWAGSPLKYVAPRYPKAAVDEGIEGCVMVEFTVEETGRTSNVDVVRSEPPHVFDQEAISAAQRIRYEPPTYKGEPVKQFGVAYLFTFQMAEDINPQDMSRQCI